MEGLIQPPLFALFGQSQVKGQFMQLLRRTHCRGSAFGGTMLQRSAGLMKAIAECVHRSVPA